MSFNYKDHIIVKHLAGSHAYGTNIESSDVDMRGIFVNTPEQCRTPFFKVNEVEDPSEEDTKFYELNNFMKLYVDMNPNIIESLWVDQKDIITGSDVYDHLRSYNQQLLSSKVAFTFSGYAMSQLKRIKGHNKHINKPQDVSPPKQIDFVSLVHNFTNAKVFNVNMRLFKDGYRLIHYGSDIYGLYEASQYSTYDNDYTLNTNSDAQLDGFHTKTQSIREIIAGIALGDTNFGKRRLPLFILKFNKQQYKDQCEIWKNYWTWKDNRNEKRSELEEKFGFDTKHAMHLVRLLRMGEEILSDGVVNVRRADAKELLEIREGKWTYDELISYAEDKDNRIRTNLYNTTSLPKKPNIKLATKVLIECQDIMWNKTNKDPRMLYIPPNARTV